MKATIITTITLALIGLASCGESKKFYDSKKIHVLKRNTITAYRDSIHHNTTVITLQDGTTRTDTTSTDYFYIHERFKIKKVVDATLTTKNETPTLKITDPMFSYSSRPIFRVISTKQPSTGKDHLKRADNTYTYVVDSAVRNFRYGTVSCAFQGLSIPLKFRHKAFNNDSFPAQTEAGFSPSLAIGCKFNLNVVKNHEDLFGKKTRVYSLTPGAFIGMSTTELSKTTTKNPTIVFTRKAPVFSAGFFLMLGYNNFNIGYSIGVDHAMGVGKGSWIYRGKIWQGLTIGFDIIKN